MLAARIAPGLGAAAEPAAPASLVATMDEAAFAAFYGRTARPLWAYLRRVTGSPELADDLVQDAFHRLLKAPLGHADEALLAAYLYRIATNLVRDDWRRQSRWRRWLSPDPPPVETAAASEAPEDGTMRRDVARAMAKLKPRERALLWLAHVEGRDHREIAGILGLKEGSVRVLLFRARARMGTLLGGGPQEDGA